MTTVKKVCELAGVSTATISRALKNPELVKEKTRKKILKAIEETGYRPNMLASSIKTGKSNTLLVLVPNLSNSFFLKIIQGIEQTAQEAGYSVLLGDTQGKQEIENKYASMALSNRADGIIQLDHTFPFSHSDAELAERIPMISVCERITGDKVYPVIELDNYNACRTLAQHLLDLGHRDFGIIAGQIDSQIFRDRLSGFKSVLIENHISFDNNNLIAGQYSIEFGREGVRKLLNNPQKPTAIFCFNDDIALGAIHEIKQHGLKVPDDISIVGFDNTKVSAYIDPPLTTVDQPTHDMGRKAVEVILTLINKQSTIRDREIFPFHFIQRKSSGPVKTSQKNL